MFRLVRRWSVLPAAVALAAVAGCPKVVEEDASQPAQPGTAAGSGTKAAPAGGAAELTLFTWTPADEASANEELLRQFEAANPGITVRLQNETGSKQAMQKLQTMVSAGTPPDVASLHGAYYMPFAGKGVLLDLEPLIAKDAAFNLADFQPQLQELCRYNGRLYSLPRYTSVYILFYNTRLFDEGGVPYPGSQQPWDWEAYLKAAKRLTRDRDGDGRTDQWGCVIDFWGSRLYPWLWQNGADLVSPDRTRVTFDSPEAIEAVQWVADLRLKRHVAPETNSSDHNEALGAFTQGDIAMFMGGPWDIQTVREAGRAQGLKWAVAPLPSRKRQATMLGTENYAILKGTKHPDEAWKLFAFLLSAPAQEKMAERLEKMPSRLSVLRGPYREAAVDFDRKVVADALDYAVRPPNLVAWGEVEPLYQQELDRIWIGQKSAAQGCRDATRRMQEVLDEDRSGTKAGG